MLWNPTRPVELKVSGIIMHNGDNLQSSEQVYHIDDVSTPVISDGFEDGDAAEWTTTITSNGSDLTAVENTPKSGSWSGEITANQNYVERRDHANTTDTGPYEFWIQGESEPDLTSPFHIGFFDNADEKTNETVAGDTSLSDTGMLFGWKILDESSGLTFDPYGRNNGRVQSSVNPSVNTYYRLLIDDVDFADGTFSWVVEDTSANVLDSGVHQFS